MLFSIGNDDWTFADTFTKKILKNLQNQGIHHSNGVIATERSSYDRRMEGTLGEIAVSKIFGYQIEQRLYKKEEYGQHSIQRGHDVGPLEVRATKYETGKLIIYRNDLDLVPFVLTIVNMQQRSVRIAGWIFGQEGKVMEFWNAGGRAANCWYVPQKSLRSPHTLKTDIHSVKLTPKNPEPPEPSDDFLSEW